MSSPSLQILLYFNAYQSIFHAIVLILIIRYKSVNRIPYGVGAGFFSVWGVVELFRLYLGYVGNLKEKVPHFAGFFFLSLLQLPIHIFLLGIQAGLMPVDQVFGAVQLAFVILELGIGYPTMRRIISNKTARFDVELKALLHPEADDDSECDELDAKQISIISNTLPTTPRTPHSATRTHTAGRRSKVALNKGIRRSPSRITTPHSAAAAASIRSRKSSSSSATNRGSRHYYNKSSYTASDSSRARGDDDYAKSISMRAAAPPPPLGRRV
eukprot:CAMPEP_0197517170 /NCGR_PEP_ID=MMETSP1318-20131121/2144_1 /TAXON_ID=552666 /ORGANISM="Partenskyella glossopodia, Strain RCC365" /LENGTH=269 /DNA_ID=CAMNT_0043066507 /DNA_START=284 /DNA_END=1093 /DNA_ORIENTATION=-